MITRNGVSASKLACLEWHEAVKDFELYSFEELKELILVVNLKKLTINFYRSRNDFNSNKGYNHDVELEKFVVDLEIALQINGSSYKNVSGFKEVRMFRDKQNMK